MASVYQKIHAFALKAQARHGLQLKGLYQTAVNTYRTDCGRQFRWQQDFDNPDMQEPPTIVPQYNISGKNLTYTSELPNDSTTNPIDKAISRLKYSSIPYFQFESQSDEQQQQQHDQHSRKCVMRSEDGWFEDSSDSENIRTGSMALLPISIKSGGGDTAPEIDSDMDSSSSIPSNQPDNGAQAEHWPRMAEQVEANDGEARFNEKPSTQSYGTNARQLITDIGTVPQNTPLKGMARLRKISPRSIKTVALQSISTIQAE